MKLFRVLLKLAALCALCSAYSSASFAQAATRDRVLNVVATQDPPTLVGLGIIWPDTAMISSKINEGLLTYDFALTPKPQLATAWEISADGLRYRFHLRAGVKWHDGKDFTAADVATSIALLKKYHPRGRVTFNNVVAVETPDALTADIVLDKPAPYLLSALSGSESPMLPHHIYDNTDALANANGKAPIGTGPFRFREWVHGSHVALERNPDYWDKSKPRIDRILVKVIPDGAARAIAFETGAIDIGGQTPIPSSDLRRIEENPNLGIETRGYSYFSGVTRLEFNLDRPILKDLRVREAIASAMNRDFIRKVIYYNYATVTASPIAPALAQFHDPEPSPYPFDIARANRLLDEAGYPRGKDGVRFRLVNYYFASEIYDPLAIYLRSTLRKIGISLDNRSYAMLRAVYNERDFDLNLTDMSNMFDPTIGVQRLYWSKAFQPGVPFTNGSHYANPDVDRLFEAAAVEIDPQQRRQQFIELQRVIKRELPAVNLVAQQKVTIYNKRVHNHTLGADGIYSNFADVFLDDKQAMKNK